MDGGFCHFNSDFSFTSELPIVARVRRLTDGLSCWVEGFFISSKVLLLRGTLLNFRDCERALRALDRRAEKNLRRRMRGSSKRCDKGCRAALLVKGRGGAAENLFPVEQSCAQEISWRMQKRKDLGVPFFLIQTLRHCGKGLPSSAVGVVARGVLPEPFSCGGVAAHRKLA